MISLNWGGLGGQLGALMEAYADLPRHIAKKHLQAAMKRTLKEAVPMLKAETPPKGATKRGRRRKGSGSSGNLKRAATAKAKYYGKNDSGTVVGVLGYRAGFESRKAIWLEFGTKKGIEPRRIVERVMQKAGPLVRGKLVKEMAEALEKAVRDKAPGVDEGYRRK